MRAASLVFLILATCQPASAHTPIEGLGGFYGGLLHPVLTPTHALALLGLGLLIGQQPAERRALPLMLFASALAAGLIALALAVGETPAGTVLLAGIAISGALVAAAFRLPLLALGLLAAAMGAAIGLDSPPEVVSLQEAIVMLIGTGLGAVIALGLVAEGAARMARDWQQIGVRVLGSWTAASALLAIAVRVAGRG
ncbi:MAG TPA: HupE/UreJ family protein [Xanthobacteraceae bacterium]|jgi:urease accessory protein